MSEKVFIYKDKDAQLLINEAGQVLLFLATESRARDLGCITLFDDETSYYKTEKESNTFRKLDAWGINHNIVKYLPTPNSLVCIKTEIGYYTIRKGNIEKYGKFMHFQQKGFELQIFVPKNQFAFTSHEQRYERSQA